MSIWSSDGKRLPVKFFFPDRHVQYAIQNDKSVILTTTINFKKNNFLE